MSVSRRGPLAGLRVVEFEGIGPAPFAAMVLADLGADVLRIERPGRATPARTFLTRGRQAVTLDLKREADRVMAVDLLRKADVVVEGMRPGVMERLGLGPDEALAANPRLIYGRMTGWGQSGPLANAAGHDLNYIAITGILDAIRPKGGKPVVPLNVIGDFGGGSMFLVTGILAALFEVRSSGRGQVVDAAICDGVNLFAGFIQAMRKQGRWNGAPGENLLDGGAPFYDTYECADGRFIAIGSLEPQFYALLRECAALPAELFAEQNNPAHWPKQATQLAEIFKQKTRGEWCGLLEGTDVCFAPVLDFDEAPAHAHNVARQAYVDVDGVPQPAAAPRLSRTPGGARPSAERYRPVAEVLDAWSDR